MDDVAGEFAETKRKPATEIKQRAEDREERSEDENGAAEFTKRVHDNIIEESEPPSASERGHEPAAGDIRKICLPNIYY